MKYFKCGCHILLRILPSIIIIVILLGCNSSPRNSNPPPTPISSFPDSSEIELDTITIASWNIRQFGQTKLNDADRINVIVDVIRKYDIIAILEVQNVSLALPDELLERINESGLNYNQVASDRLGRGSQKEQYLFIYDDDKIDYVVNSSGYSTESNDEYSREPFYAQFEAGNFDFYLMVIHTKPDSVHIEVPALKDSYLELQNNTDQENDIILLGDFNAKPPKIILPDNRTTG